MAIRDIVPFGNRRRQQLTRRGDAQDPFTRMHEDLDRLFRNFFSGLPGGLTDAPDIDQWGLRPDIDVSENDKEIQIKAELPGVTANDFNVQLEGNALVISGEKKEESEDKEGDFYRTECRYGSFTRAIPLSAEVDTERIDASFKNGVLRIKLPKLSEDKSSTKRIEVKHS